MPTAQGHITVRRRAKNGNDGIGVTITSQTIRYATSTSGTVKPTSWGKPNVIPAVANGNYLWTWTHVVYSDNTVTDSYSVSRMGIDGKGIQSSVVTYCQKANTSTKPEDFPASDWGAFPTSLTDGYWLYMRTHIVYSDGATTDSYSVSQIGVGAYYAGVSEYYAAGASATDVPQGAATPGTYVNGQTISTTWSQQRPTLNIETPYLWNFEISADSRGNRYVTDARCIGNFARGIVSIVETYAISAYSDPGTGRKYPSDITSWTDEQQNAAPTEVKPFQWNKTEVTYNDGIEDFYHISAVKGADGKGAVYIDIDNDNDSIMYDGTGNTRIGDAATANLYLYDNGQLKNATFTVFDWSLGTLTAAERPTISGIQLTIPHIKKDAGYVIVRCLYNSVPYYGRVTVKRLLGKDKYELVVTPNAITYNDSAGEASADHVDIKVYRTAQNGTRTVVAKLADYSLKLRYYYGDQETPVSITDKTSSNPNGYASGVNRQIYPNIWNQYRFEILDGNDNILDYETVTIGHISNGETGNGISRITQYWLATSAASGVTKQTSGWTTAVQTMTETKRYLWYYEDITYTNGDTDTFGPTIIGVFGQTGYGIVTSVQRDNFTEAQWNTYGTVGHSESWSDTSSVRNGARVGDLFTVVGKATDTGNAHTLTYRCTNASGNLAGVCISHAIAEAGENGENGIRYWLEPNVKKVKRYHTGDLSAIYFTCLKRKQEGKGAISEATDAVMSYTYTNGGSDTTVDNYSGGTVYIGLWWTKVVIKLKVGGVEVAKETIDVEDVANSIGNNLLNGTNFVDASDDGTTFASNKELIPNAVDGQTALRCLGTFANAAIVNFYQHKIIRTGDIRVQPSTWYTLSFWAKGEAYVQANENITSPNYGFAQESFYAIAGVQYTLYVNGYCNSQAVSESRQLRTFVYNSDWSWNQSNATSSTTATTFAITFTVPTTGTYYISSYVYPNTSSGAVTSAQCRVNWYRLYRERKMTTYVYPSLIDTSQVQVIDGEIRSDGRPTDGNNTLSLSTTWVKHTFSFKTKSTLPTTDQHVLFRLPEGCNGAQVCMVKLERGVFATEWCRSEYDKTGAKGLDGCIQRISEWVEGVEFRNDEGLTTGTRYLDIAVVTKGANSFDAYKCLRTHTSSSSIPVTNTTYWQKFNNMQPIYTPMIMAQYALLRFSQTNQLLVMKSDGTTVAAGMGGGTYPLWVGATTPENAPFKVDINGKLIASGCEIKGNSTIEGMLKGVTGSFHSLDCLDYNGVKNGGIDFNSGYMRFSGQCTFSGGVTFNGEIHHQGGDIFYAGNIFCRGMFAAMQRYTVIVMGSYAYYFPTQYLATWDVSKAVYVSLNSVSSGGRTYYRIDCYSPNGYDALAGMPIDTVLFRISGSTTYYYILDLHPTQRVFVCNINDDQNNVVICCNGQDVTWNGGEISYVQNMGYGRILPSKTSNVLGAGQIVGPFRDNNW